MNTSRLFGCRQRGAPLATRSRIAGTLHHEPNSRRRRSRCAQKSRPGAGGRFRRPGTLGVVTALAVISALCGPLTPAPTAIAQLPAQLPAAAAQTAYASSPTSEPCFDQSLGGHTARAPDCVSTDPRVSVRTYRGTSSCTFETQVNWGDGSTEPGGDKDIETQTYPGTGTTLAAQFVHIYRAPGRYAVTVTTWGVTCSGSEVWHWQFTYGAVCRACLDHGRGDDGHGSGDDNHDYGDHDHYRRDNVDHDYRYHDYRYHDHRYHYSGHDDHYSGDDDDHRDDDHHRPDDDHHHSSEVLYPLLTDIRDEPPARVHSCHDRRFVPLAPAGPE